MGIETWEYVSYVVTAIGLPLAIFVFIYEKREERENDDEEVYQLLSDNYQDFLKIVLANSDLRMFSTHASANLTEEQKERMLVIFSLLISLFERAYLLLHNDRMTKSQQRRWSSWEDYMQEWCGRGDFRKVLVDLLRGEDPEFSRFILTLKDRAPESR
jgi:hypothetical protein